MCLSMCVLVGYMNTCKLTAAECTSLVCAEAYLEYGHVCLCLGCGPCKDIHELGQNKYSLGFCMYLYRGLGLR